MQFKEFRKKYQGKYYKSYVDCLMYIHIVKIEPSEPKDGNYPAIVDSVAYADGYIVYHEGERWYIYEDDFNIDGAFYLEVSKKVYDEHLRRYKLECEWTSQGIAH